MRLKSLLALLGGSLSLLATQPLAHADYEGFELGGFGGIHFFNDDNELGFFDEPDADSLKNAFTFGARLGYDFAFRLAVEGELAIAQTRSRESEVEGTTFGWRLNALYHILPGRVRPFALFGFGGSTLSSEDPDAMRNDTDFVWHAGAGLKADIDHNWGVRFDARWLLPPSSENEFVTSDFELLLGLYKTFGDPPKPAPAQPLDSDNDGIPDADDQCPNEPEDMDGTADSDGCPDDDPPPPPADTDGDGITDDADRCPEQAEDMDQFEDQDGCPDLDNDMDGVADADDKCPMEAETKNGYQDQDGCPDQVPEQVKQFTGAIEGIRFVTGSAKIKPGSRKVLDKAVAVLKEYPKVRLEIGGHTDNVGKEQFNTELSQKRAESVRDYMTSKGIAASRLEARGYGPSQPVANNETPAGRAKNRRVEFKLIQN